MSSPFIFGALIFLLPAISPAAGPVAKGQLLASSNYTSLATASTTANAFIAAYLEDNGRFTIGTVEGDPGRDSDDNKKLIFGHPTPGTSDTFIQIDGVSSSIHGGVGTLVSDAASSSVTLTVGVIQILERLRIVQSQGTRNEDTIEIYFRLTNTDSVAHTVSLRTQLDTQLGNNDGAPFRVSGVGEITHDTEFDNDSGTAPGAIPTNALVFDNLANPSIIALLTFRYGSFPVPGRVVFGYWPDAVGQFDYTVDPSNNFLDNNDDGTISGSSPDSDSSVIVYWGYPAAINLAPGASVEFAMLYGLGDCTYNSGTPFSVLVCSPSQLVGSVVGATYQYSPSPLPLDVFFINSVGVTAVGGKAYVSLTPDFELAAGETLIKPIETSAGDDFVLVGGSAQLSWNVQTNARYLGERQVGVTVDAHGQKYTVLRGILVPPIPNVLYGTATDDQGNPIAGGAITVYAGDNVVGSATTQSTGRYVVTGLTPGTYRVRLSATGRPDSYFSAYVNSETDSGSTTNPSAFGAAGGLQAFSYPNPVRDGSAKISFYANGSGNGTVDIYDIESRKVKSISISAPGAGWHEVDWAIDHVANGIYFFLVDFGGDTSHGKIAVLKRRRL